MHKCCRTSILEIVVPVKENSVFGGGRSDSPGYTTKYIYTILAIPKNHIQFDGCQVK